MKIVQILHGDSIGGMEKFCIDLSNALSKEHTVLFVGNKFFKQYLDDSVYFVEMDIEKGRNNIFFLWWLFKILKNFKADIIHLHKQKSIQIIKRLKFFIDTPFIATKHDIQKKKSFYGLEYVATITEETSKTVKAKYDFRIYNGIDFKKPQKIDMPKVFNIVAVGGLRKVKGYDNLIKSVSLLNFDYHLTIVGEGEERKNLEDLVDRLKISKKVSLVGFKENVNDYLFSSNIQIISSISEGFSLAMIEGIFYSSVLLSTKVSGCIDILPDELLYDSDNLTKTIEMVYQNYDRYKDIFANVKKEYLEQLTMQKCKDNYVDVYRKIIEIEQY